MCNPAHLLYVGLCTELRCLEFSPQSFFNIIIIKRQQSQVTQCVCQTIFPKLFAGCCCSDSPVGGGSIKMELSFNGQWLHFFIISNV